MKIALVTGAGRGLGKGFAQILSANGYIVYAGIRGDIASKEAANIQYIQLDVASDQSIQRAIAQIKEGPGKLDLLINNAGLNKDTATNGQIEKATKLDSLECQVIQKMFDVNAIGPLMMAKYAVPLMTAPGSFIINISSNRASFSSDTNTNGNYGYRASKVALNMFTQCLLFDLPKNVSTFAVHPGGVKTDMNPDGTLMPDQAATLIMQIIENWKPELNGKYLRNDGSLHPL